MMLEIPDAAISRLIGLWRVSAPESHADDITIPDTVVFATSLILNPVAYIF